MKPTAPTTDVQAAEPATESPRQAELLRFAEITSAVTHEFNNILNNILLQIAILEQAPAAAIPAAWSTIRSLGMDAAGLVRELQHLGQQFLPTIEPVDLNQIIRQTVGELAASGDVQPPHLQLAAELPPIQGNVVML